MRPHQQLSNMMHIYRQTMDRAPHNSVQGNSSGHAKKRKRPELERDEKDMELDDGGKGNLFSSLLCHSLFTSFKLLTDVDTVLLLYRIK